MKHSVPEVARTRVKLLAASALAVLLAACGDHPPKDRDDDKPAPPPPPAISVVAGDPAVSGAVNGTGAAARFNEPSGIAIDAAGNLYVADYGNNVIRKITPSGAVSTFAGEFNRSESVDGTGSSARFGGPSAMTIDGGGILYAVDGYNVRRIDTSAQVSTIYRLPIGSNVDSRASLYIVLRGIAADASGNLYLTNGPSTRRISNTGVSMLEGDLVIDNLFGTRLIPPRGIAVDSGGSVYLWSIDNRVSKWTPNGAFGLGSMAPLTLTGSAAPSWVESMAVDSQGNLYASHNTLIRKITPAGVVSVFAGSGDSSTVVPGPLPGGLATVRGMATDGKGNLYVTSGHAIVKIRLP